MKNFSLLALLSASASVLGAPYPAPAPQYSGVVSRDDGPWNDCDAPGLDGLFASPMVHGHTDKEDNVQCAAAFKSGIFPNRLEAEHKESEIHYLKISYTDGTNKEFGKRPDEDGKVGIVSWDPYRDSFSEFRGLTNSDTGRVFSLHIRVRDCDRDECGFDLGSQNGDSHERGPADSGILLGFHAGGEDKLNWLVPYFTTSGVDKVRFTDPVFSPSLAELNDMDMGENMMERKVATHIIDNRNSSTEAKMQYESGRTVEKQTKVSVTNEEGTDSGFEAGVNAKMEMSFSIPVIGGGSTSLETHTKYDERVMRKSIENTEDMEKVTDVTMYTIDKVVKPGKLLEATSIAIQAKLDLDYDAKLELVFKNRKSFQVPIRGTFREADYQEFTTTYKEYDEEDLVENDVEMIKRDEEEDTVIYSGSGTFCPNGKRAGDFGMSKQEFIEKCDLA